MSMRSPWKVQTMPGKHYQVNEFKTSWILCKVNNIKVAFLFAPLSSSSQSQRGQIQVSAVLPDGDSWEARLGAARGLPGPRTWMRPFCCEVPGKTGCHQPLGVSPRGQPHTASFSPVLKGASSGDSLALATGPGKQWMAQSRPVLLVVSHPFSPSSALRLSGWFLPEWRHCEEDFLSQSWEMSCSFDPERWLRISTAHTMFPSWVQVCYELWEICSFCLIFRWNVRS